MRGSVEWAEYKNVVLGLILLKFASVQAEVSAQGACQLKNLADGKYIITAEKAGWEPQTAVVYINAGEMSSVTLQLTALSN